LVAPGYEQARAEALAGERISEFLARVKWAAPNGRRWLFKLPTICIINGAPVLQRQWLRRRIKPNDSIHFESRPHGGRNGKMIAGIIGAIALAAFAPWAAGYLAGTVLGLTGTALTVATGAFTAAIAIGGSLAMHALIRPNAGGQNAGEGNDQVRLYSTQARGNMARPGEPKSMHYGRLLIEPDFYPSRLPWSEFEGDEQYLNVLLCRGLGKYEIEQVRTEDTIVWDTVTGLNSAFEGSTVEHFEPGETITTFPINVVTSVEVNGQQLPSGVGGEGWVGPYVANASGTQTNKLAFDVVWPAGCYVMHPDGWVLARAVTLVAEARPVDNDGTPTGGFTELFSETFTLNSRKPVRKSIPVALSPGRWDVRLRRTNAPFAGTNGTDEVVWAGLRAFIVGVEEASTDCSSTALRIKASAFTQQSVRLFSVLQTRILPVWNTDAETWTEQPTRNPYWAFYDAATNPVYGPRRAPTNRDFQAVVTNALSADAAGITFDYQFRSAVKLPDAFDTILKVARARHRWSGDMLSIVVDQFNALPRMLITDREIVRGSASIEYVLNTEDSADCVIFEYVDETTWQPAEVQFPPDGEFVAHAPARMRVDGIVNRDNARDMAAFLWLQSQHRRIRPTISTEYDGRVLGFGDTIAVQMDLPKWGATAAVIGRLDNVLTVDRQLPWADSGQHYVAWRTRTGRQFGPVKCAKADNDNLALVELDETDVSSYETALSMTLEASLARAEGGEEPSVAFGTLESGVVQNCLVLAGRPSGSRVQLALVVNSADCYPEALGAAPALPTAPSLVDPATPIIQGLFVRFRQGVAEPILDGSWWPAPGAESYRADVSYDEGASWTPIYGDREPSFSALVDRAALRVRVQGIGQRRGPYSEVDLEAPTIVLGPGVVAPESLGDELFARVRQIDLRVARDIEELNRRINDLATATHAHFASLRERVGRTSIGSGQQYTENYARITQTQEAVTNAEESLATLTTTLETGYVSNGALSTALAETILIAESNAESAIAAEITALEAVYETIGDSDSKIAKAKFEAIAFSMATANEALVAFSNSLNATYETTTGAETKISEASIEILSMAAADADSAIAAVQTTLQASIDASDLIIASHTTDIATAVSLSSANASTLSSLSSTVAGHTSSISTINTSITDLDSGLTTLASSLTTLTSDFEDLDAEISVRFLTGSGPSGSLAAYDLKLTADGNTPVGMQAYTDSGGDGFIRFGAPQIQFGEFGDDNSFATAFEVVSGDVYFRGDLYALGGIYTVHVATDGIETINVLDGAITSTAAATGSSDTLTAVHTGNVTKTAVTTTYNTTTGRIVVIGTIYYDSPEILNTHYVCDVEILVDGVLKQTVRAPTLTNTVWNNPFSTNQVYFRIAGAVTIQALITGLTPGNRTVDMRLKTTYIGGGTVTQTITYNGATVTILETKR